LASSIVWTSTITDILSFSASSYNSSAVFSLTPAKIIKIASAP